MPKPSTAPRLLLYLMWAQPPNVVPIPGTGGLQLPSVRRVARLLGTDSNQAARWVDWLETHGYIDSVYWTPSRRSVHLRIVRPPNIGVRDEE